MPCRTGAAYERILKVNVVGTFLVTKTFLPLLMKKNTRTVVQISSGLGSLTRNRLGITAPDQNPVADKWIAYNASKAALNMRKHMSLALCHAKQQLVQMCRRCSLSTVRSTLQGMSCSHSIARTASQGMTYHFFKTAAACTGCALMHIS